MVENYYLQKPLVNLVQTKNTVELKQLVDYSISQLTENQQLIYSFNLFIVYVLFQAKSPNITYVCYINAHLLHSIFAYCKYSLFFSIFKCCELLHIPGHTVQCFDLKVILYILSVSLFYDNLFIFY